MSAAILFTLVYIGMNLAIKWVANEKLRICSECGGRKVAVFASPPPVMFWKRDLVWRDGQCYRRRHYDVLAGGWQDQVSQCTPTNMDDPIVRRAIAADPRMQKFLKWSILPQADVIRERCQVRVAIGDARYGQGRRSRLARETVMLISGPECLDGQPARS